jgi:lipopolysaccharide heptosyltransferase II
LSSVIKAPTKILIIRLSSIGDIIITTPLVRAVRQKFPEAQIDFVIKKQFAGLMKHNPHIDHLLIFDKEKGISPLKQKIAQTGYDLVVDIHKNIRSSILKMSSKAISTTYPKYIFRRTLLVKFGMNLYQDIQPVYLRYFKAVEKFGVSYDHQGTEVFFEPSDHETVRESLREKGYRPGQELVVICPGASYSNKQWLPERFAEVADQLAEKGCFVCLHGGKADVDLCVSISNIMKHNVHLFANQFSLLESAAFLKMAHLAITNDSGMMHLAQSQKTPVVAIFGPTSRELGYFPLPGNSAVVEKNVSCRPCTHNGLNYCPKKHFRCMREIEVNDVADAAFKFLTTTKK